MKKLTLLALFISQTSHAALVSLGPVAPTNWRIENYVPGVAIAWYTGSACANGQLSFPTTATVQDHSRFYATVTAAKAGNQKVFVVYENGAAGCPISSFGIQ